MIKKEYVLLYKINRKYELHYLRFDLILNYKYMNFLINIRIVIWNTNYNGRWSLWRRCSILATI